MGRQKAWQTPSLPMKARDNPMNTLVPEAYYRWATNSTRFHWLDALSCLRLDLIGFLMCSRRPFGELAAY